jgi:type IX secretion system PorP/SprF family membrane protein
MQIKKISIGLLFILISGLNLQAQQVPTYSQYVLNGFLINPAMAGAEGYSTVNLIAREQWIGVQDAPSTYALSFHTKLMRNSFIKRKKTVRRKRNYGFTDGKVGLGGYLFSDHNGPLSRTGMRISYAYHLYNKSSRSQLSFGLSLTGYQLKFDENKVILRDPDDDIWFSARESIFIPDSDVGVYFNTPEYFVGFSADQLLESIIKFGSKVSDQYKLERNYYLFGGYDFELSNQLVLEPSTLLKFAENGAFQGDLGVKLYFDQSYWGGLTYRTGNALIISAGISIDRYVFGYAFDYSLSSIMKHSLGTHEFMFALKWGDNSKRYRWLNR